MSERDLSLAKILAQEGLDFDREIGTDTTTILKTFPKVDPFLLLIAHSLTWTGHAINKGEYLEKVVKYLETGSDNLLSELAQFSGRFGAERLEMTIFNWKKLLYEIKKPDDVLTSSLDEIISFQNRFQETACMARRKRSIMYIGAWLFCAPFKILLSVRDDLWHQERIDEILMPLGLEVVRGCRKLIREQYSYGKMIEGIDLSEEEGDILEGLGTVQIVQGMCKRIAQDSHSIVLHINSGLWKFGAGELSKF